MSEPQPLPSQFFTMEAQYLLDASAETERRHIEAARERARQQAEAEAGAAKAAAAIDTERRAAEQRNEDELRDTLQDAIDAHHTAMIHVGIAQGNVDRAAQRMSEADSELDDYGDLDQQIADWHIQQIRHDAHDHLPLTLANAQRDRGVVIDRLDAAHKAYDHLLAELKLAQRDLAECTAQRSRAASHVVAKHMDGIAIELNAILDQANILRRKLLSAGSAWISTSNGTAPLQISVVAREAIWRQLPDMQPDTAYIDTIRSFHTALLNDANANAPDDEPADDPDA